MTGAWCVNCVMLVAKLVEFLFSVGDSREETAAALARPEAFLEAFPPMGLETGHVDADLFGAGLIPRDEAGFVQAIDGVPREPGAAGRLGDARHDERLLRDRTEAAVAGGQEVERSGKRRRFGRS